MDIVKDTMSLYGLAPLPSKPVEAMAYVQFQPNGAETYAPIRAFEAGTMFPTLDKPWFGSKCKGDYK